MAAGARLGVAAGVLEDDLAPYRIATVPWGGGRGGVTGRFAHQLAFRSFGTSAGALTASGHREHHKKGYLNLEVSAAGGVAGRLMCWLADRLHWFEEHLVLKSGGEGLIGLVHRIGGYLIRIDQLLSQPRYLLLLVMATFVVII